MNLAKYEISKFAVGRPPRRQGQRLLFSWPRRREWPWGWHWSARPPRLLRSLHPGQFTNDRDPSDPTDMSRIFFTLILFILCNTYSENSSGWGCSSLRHFHQPVRDPGSSYSSNISTFFIQTMIHWYHRPCLRSSKSLSGSVSGRL